MKYEIEVSSTKSGQEHQHWTEDYDDRAVTTQAEAEAKGKYWVDYYNSTLRSGEAPRKFISAKLSGGSEAHTWDKRGLVTVCKGGLSYDTMRCTACGITGKRYGLGQGGVVIDKKFAKKYPKCPGKLVT